MDLEVVWALILNICSSEGPFCLLQVHDVAEQARIVEHIPIHLALVRRVFDVACVSSSKGLTA